MAKGFPGAIQGHLCVLFLSPLNVPHKKHKRNKNKTFLGIRSLLLDGSKIFKTFRYPEKEEEFSLPPADNGLIKFQTQAPPPLNSARPLSHPPLPTFNLPWLGEERGIQHGLQISQNIRDSLEMYLVIFSTLVD